MLNTIKKLYSMNRAIVSDGVEEAINILAKEIPLKITKIKTGTKCFTWKIPQKWEVEEAKLIDETTGKVVLDYKDNPLHLYVGSLPFEGILDFKELDKHLRHKPARSKNKNAIPYVFKYYELDWGFSLSENQYKRLNKKHKFRVVIKTKYTDGHLVIGESIVKGKTNKEIVVVSHIDHPYQANDNLSGVAVAVQMVKEIKSMKLPHTVRFVFTAETIGSIAYMWTRRKSFANIDFALILDTLGNKNKFIIQRTMNSEDPVNYLCEQACTALGFPYQFAEFRQLVGSDELIFSDPTFGIPAALVTTWPYPQYHTNLDTPDIIDEKTLKKSKELMIKILKNIDRNFVPKRNWIGPLMRSQIGWFLGRLPEDTHLEVFGYKIDGKKTVLDIAKELGMDLDLALDYAEDLKKQGLCSQVS